MPEIYVIGGCNGSGKTTFALNTFPSFGNIEFVNADIIATQLNPDNPELVDTIRYCLKEMKSLDLIEIKIISTDQTIIIEKITSTGKLVIKGERALSELIDNNNNYHINNHYSSGDNISGDKNITNIYNSQNSTQAAADIQALLEQLDKNYNLNTTTGKMTIATQAIEAIDNDANFTSRIISALKSGSISALESLLDHPAASFFIAALEDWQQTEK